MQHVVAVLQQQLLLLLLLRGHAVVTGLAMPMLAEQAPLCCRQQTSSASSGGWGQATVPGTLTGAPHTAAVHMCTRMCTHTHPGLDLLQHAAAPSLQSPQRLSLDA